MADMANENFIWASHLIHGLAAGGVTHAVISPGSRSTPLVLACLQHPGLKTWVQVDERSAAFFALGLAKASRQPVILVCTSGSAPANWFSAVIEADMGGIPLVLLSADRPAELRDCGANQSIDQAHLFGGHVRAFHELPAADARPEMLRYLRTLAAQVMDQCRWPLPGPVHVNVPLREPLVPAGPLPQIAEMASVVASHPHLSLPPEECATLARELGGGKGLIVCGWGEHGPDFPEAIAALASKLGCTVLADPLSGLRFGSHVRDDILCRYDAFLRRGSAHENLRPDWVLRFGAMPVSKALQHFLTALPAMPHIVVDAGGRWPDPLHLATRLVRADPALLCRQLASGLEAAAPSSWRAAFQAEELRAAALARHNAPLEAAVVQAVVDLLPAGGTLFSGNSMAIRDLDAFSGSGAKPLRIIGNRGASGIDGNVSSALGLAAGGSRPVVALLGDLAFYHDMNGLLAARGLDVTLVVLNNGGGGIFEFLPQAQLEDFERAWLTPLGLDFAHAAGMYGLGYQKISRAADFPAALAGALSGGAHLIEVTVERDVSVALHRAYWMAVAEN
ncbi:MAG: 2-succinyl-5-enolpyruvyl-6-hydroxy-3-cyclohexene-1-carboxylic-acid synthase [Sulfurimicrobium sp.]|nr:2-succinyl-5-enolpyruvyl-6-hydroxy-3-cyclohexene-1-carboxylic-acid synthase [Sulfurimicrobium sp.]MDZ7657484.1 2-succinyl-5-enolpyruvyl-6-hydroxy-3-cyclohexene-1-carboxylic-acid synthase [Sulfurimicrobium sp.]